MIWISNHNLSLVEKVWTVRWICGGPIIQDTWHMGGTLQKGVHDIKTAEIHTGD